MLRSSRRGAERIIALRCFRQRSRWGIERGVKTDFEKTSIPSTSEIGLRRRAKANGNGHFAPEVPGQDESAVSAL